MTDREKKRGSSGTDAVHAGTRDKRAHHTLTPSIAQTATYTFADTADLERYMRGEDQDQEREEYGRYGNPTVREVEKRIAALEGAQDAVAFGSGMAAVTTAVLSLTRAGDHVVLFKDCYRRTRQFVTDTLGRFGVKHTLVGPGDLTELEQAIVGETRLVIGESPTNPYLYCTDLSALARIAKAKGRVRTLVDSTFATPYNLRPVDHGVDLVVHSATKYLSGHNDVLGGFVAGAAHLVSLVRDLRNVLGGILDPHAAFLIGRGLKTLALRVERQNTTGLEVARMLESHAEVDRVYYPLLPSHPSYSVAVAQMRGAGGVVSFVVKGGRSAASRVVDRVKLAKIAPSLGGVETLIEQPAIMSYAELSDEELGNIGIDPALIRLSVGVEDAEDVLADLRAALDA
jgi:cystathionine gamma-synthase